MIIKLTILIVTIWTKKVITVVSKLVKRIILILTNRKKCPTVFQTNHNITIFPATMLILTKVQTTLIIKLKF
jgi:hypothetical protein